MAASGRIIEGTRCARPVIRGCSGPVRGQAFSVWVPFAGTPEWVGSGGNHDWVEVSEEDAPGFACVQGGTVSWPGPSLIIAGTRMPRAVPLLLLSPPPSPWHTGTYPFSPPAASGVG